MTSFKNLWCGALLASVVLAAGCAAPGVKHVYSGAQKPDEELATVWGTTNQPGRVFNPARERITITAVDGDATMPWYSPRDYPATVKVLPGKHELGLRYEYIHGVAHGTIWVDAQAGRIYEVRVMNPQSRTERVYFLIQDITAQTLVGGQEEKTDTPIGP